jgi:Trm5-related predicted tRNA methylase
MDPNQQVEETHPNLPALIVDYHNSFSQTEGHNIEYMSLQVNHQGETFPDFCMSHVYLLRLTRKTPINRSGGTAMFQSLA